MLKLYRSRRHADSFIAYSLETGWVIFPDTVGGWEKRRRAFGLDPMHQRQAPASLAAHTGFPLPSEMNRAA
jgi:hypothetical protein